MNPISIYDFLPKNVAAQVEEEKYACSFVEPSMSALDMEADNARGLLLAAQESWGAQSVALVPLIAAYLHSRLNTGEWIVAREPACMWGNGAFVQIGDGAIQVAELDRLSVSRVAVITPGLPEGVLLEFRRGRNHPLEQRFAQIRAFVLLDKDFEPTAARLAVEANDCRCIGLSIDKNFAKTQLTLRLGHDCVKEVKEFSGSSLLDLISCADVLSVLDSCAEYAVTDRGQEALRAVNAPSTRRVNSRKLAEVFRRLGRMADQTSVQFYSICPINPVGYACCE